MLLFFEKNFKLVTGQMSINAHFHANEPIGTKMTKTYSAAGGRENPILCEIQEEV